MLRMSFSTPSTLAPEQGRGSTRIPSDLARSRPIREGTHQQSAIRDSLISVHVSAGRSVLLDRQRQQLLSRRAYLDGCVHLRTDPAIEARRPAAVIHLRLVEGVLPVLPEPVLV